MTPTEMRSIMGYAHGRGFRSVWCEGMVSVIYDGEDLSYILRTESDPPESGDYTKLYLDFEPDQKPDECIYVIGPSIDPLDALETIARWADAHEQVAS